MRRANRIEEELRELTSQLECVAQQIQNLAEELSDICIGENQREIHDESISVTDTVKIINPPTLLG